MQQAAVIAPCLIARLPKLLRNKARIWKTDAMVYVHSSMPASFSKVNFQNKKSKVKSNHP
jgi:hypothetical protein